MDIFDGVLFGIAGLSILMIGVIVGVDVGYEEVADTICEDNGYSDGDYIENGDDSYIKCSMPIIKENDGLIRYG